MRSAPVIAERARASSPYLSPDDRLTDLTTLLASAYLRMASTRRSKEANCLEVQSPESPDVGPGRAS